MWLTKLISRIEINWRRDGKTHQKTCGFRRLVFRIRNRYKVCCECARRCRDLCRAYMAGVDIAVWMSSPRCATRLHPKVMITHMVINLQQCMLYTSTPHTGLAPVCLMLSYLLSYINFFQIRQLIKVILLGGAERGKRGTRPHFLAKLQKMPIFAKNSKNRWF